MVNRQNNVNSIRNRYTNVNRRPIGRDLWSGGHPGHNAHNWRWQNRWSSYPSSWCRRPATWAACGTWFAAWNWSQPNNYDYGNTVVYRDNNVYIGDKQYATAEVYYDQAETIAQSIPAETDTEKIEWMPLGVFAVTEESVTDSGRLLQLAVSKEGILAGTFYNETTDSGRPVEGMVDSKSQRASWMFSDGKNTDLVMETGIYNLTQDEATMLVHFGPEKTQNWLLIRLPEAEEENGG